MFTLPLVSNITMAIITNGYNNNRLNESHKELKLFVSTLENQISEGRESIEISIESSASKVPTTTYSTNMNLATKRAEGIKEMLTKLIKNNELLSGKVTVSIAKTAVNGPAYAGDPDNLAKYGPFQYIKLKVQPVGEGDIPEGKDIRSKDAVLQGKFNGK